MKAEPEQKGGLTLTPTERTAVAEHHPATKTASIVGLNEEEIRFAIEYSCGREMGHQAKAYKVAFPDVTDNYASVRASELLRREKVSAYSKMITTALMERLIVHAGGPERLANWETDALEAKAILRAARRRAIRLTSVESGNLQYAINRALGTPVQVSDVTNRDEAATIAALTRYAARIAEDRLKLEVPG